jgi:hypothetical protein
MGPCCAVALKPLEYITVVRRRMKDEGRKMTTEVVYFHALTIEYRVGIEGTSLLMATPLFQDVETMRQICKR